MAADRTFDVSVVLGLVDKMSSSLKQIDQSISGTTKALGSLAVAGVSIYTITNSLKQAVVAAAHEEAAMVRLQFAVEKAGTKWAVAQQQIQKYLETAQKTSKYSGGELIPGLQKMVKFTGDLQKAIELTNLAMDLASYNNIDLEQAITAVAMATQGNIRYLSMLVPGLRGVTKETIAMSTSMTAADYAINMTRKTVGGYAKNELKQVDAMLQQVDVKTGNLSQSIGKKLEPVTRFVIATFGEFIDIMRRTIEKSYLLEVGLGLLAIAVVYFGVVTATALPQLVLIAAAIGALATGILAALDALEQYLDKQNSSQAIHDKIMAQYAARIKANEDEIKSIQASADWFTEEVNGVIGPAHAKITALQESNALLRKISRDAEKQNIIDTTNEVTSTTLTSWTEWYASLNAIQKTSADIGLGFINASQMELDKAMKEGLDSINNYALKYDNISSLMIGSILRTKKEQELIDKRKYEEGIIAMTTAWERYYYQMDGYSQNWLNKAIENYTKYFAYVEFGISTITDYMNKAYQLRSLIISNEKEDALAAIDEKYVADQNRISTTVANEQEKETQLAELDREYMNSKAALEKDAKEKQRKAYEEQKNWSRNAAIIDGAVAIIKTFAAYGFTPLGFVAAAAQAASTAMQVAIIDATRYATGIIGAPGGMALVGEQGPELINLPQGSDVFSASATRSMLAGAGAGGININLNISGNYIMNERNAEGLADIISNIIVGRVKKERLI